MRSDALSPVIGVILLVAITVILAAVIAAFVFGMAYQVSVPIKTKVLTVDENTIKVTLTSENSILVRFLNDTPLLVDVPLGGFSGVYPQFGHCYNITGWYEVECPT
jgi:flagellin-like protein